MGDLKRDARHIFDAAVRAADPAECVRRALAGRRFERPVTVVGAGKAAVPMAQAVEELVPQARGVVVTKYGHGAPTKRIRVLEAAHPVPDEAGVRATREILAELRGDPVLCLLSGGGSALLTAPADGLTLADKQAATDRLLRAGATIDELNCVRKHLSAIKGGRLAQAAHAPVLSLILSDVIGDRLDVIASGPTAPDPTTVDDARRIARAAGVPEGVCDRMRETPKPGEPAFARVENVIVGSNRLALDAAAAEARKLGYVTENLTAELQGEAREAAKRLVEEARRRRGRACLLAGGETTVTVRGAGRGGRCQELALAAAIELRGEQGVVLLAAGTDGTDGPTDAAGAVVDGATADAEAPAYLDRNDAYSFFHARGGLVVTGPTRTNVMDVIVILKKS